MIDIWQAVSLIGSLSLLLGYFMLVTEAVGAHSKTFYGLNAVGCLLIGLSLWFSTFNLGSFILQVVFFIVSVYGLWKYR